jgi:hypothetical protein
MKSIYTTFHHKNCSRVGGIVELRTQKISSAYTYYLDNWSWGGLSYKLEVPLNVPCPTCKAKVGLPCKSNQPWKRKRSNSWWAYSSGAIPHPDRVREGKIQEVIDKLSGV